MSTEDKFTQAELDKFIADLKPSKRFYKVHGNYCGPGNRGGAPVDKIDAMCQLHDICYLKHGRHHPDCDKNFTNWIEGIDPSTLTKQQQRIRYVILKWLYHKISKQDMKDLKNRV